MRKDLSVWEFHGTRRLLDPCVNGLPFETFPPFGSHTMSNAQTVSNPQGQGLVKKLNLTCTSQTLFGSLAFGAPSLVGSRFQTLL